MKLRSSAALLAALALSACAAIPAPEPARPVQATPSAPKVPASMQWLYGSGEAAATGIQAYHAMRNYVLQSARQRPTESAILAEGSTLQAPRFMPCGDKPLAVVLDGDETVIQNLGYEYDEAVKGRTYDPKIWERWEATGADKVAPIPGAVSALRAIRAAGVTVIINSNRVAKHAAQTTAALNGAGIGPVKFGETLFLKDATTGSEKDSRRALIASRYCVVAMAGDQLGDFSDLLNDKSLSIPDRRRFASSGAFAAKWGAGWFMLPNPVYGPSIRGDFDDVFPIDKRWVDPAGEGAE